MNHSRSYPRVTRRWSRSVEHECPQCGRTLQQAMTLTRRTVITLQEVIRLIHAGYRCPDPQCPGHQRTYRSPAADALALPGFTFGLDIVLVVGQRRLGKHQTGDEVHEELLSRLAPLGVSISRREILSLFEASGTLLRASSEVKEDQEWLAQVKTNGGLIDAARRHPARPGPRDHLPGARCPHGTGADGRASDLPGETAVMKALLAPVVA